ncbi:hypothetical protein Msil_3350 [Methylocella silvestris BL2]|uniref:Uncharacterized protein n=1 Tax=Methylocella silvestris (strain DSM 15510 / CIP 108128 / LMG 27833 / NCIMB 13906 / BL2) TaxID=395965 RepID=B8ES41_METSB|nr:hypothetical protein [Methylocella silvestris]ACK52256.1 hypothetical protein Msil_3350 [Methylocella silvestris BL2]
MTTQCRRSAPGNFGSRSRARLFGSSARAHRAAANIFVMMRSDGAVMISRAPSPAGGPSVGVATPVVFAFRSVEEADAVMAGTRQRLETPQADGWLAGVSAGQAATGVKAEAKGLSYSFEVIHPNLKGAPIIGGRRRGRAWRLAVAAFYAIVLSAVALTGLVIGLELT